MLLLFGVVLVEAGQRLTDHEDHEQREDRNRQPVVAKNDAEDARRCGCTRFRDRRHAVASLRVAAEEFRKDAAPRLCTRAAHELFLARRKQLTDRP